MRRAVGGCVLTVLLFFISGTLQAQQFSYAGENVPLSRLFKEIRRQTGVSVVWNEKDFNVNQSISTNYKKAGIKSVMDDLSTRLSMTYTIIGKMIVVKQKPGPLASPYTINKPQNSISDSAEIDLQQVDIVSTGYQLIPKERAPGSFVLVDSAQIERRVGRDIFTRLEGVTSGLLFNRNTVSSNSGNLDLAIRSRSTIYANDQPLIVLDNFPYNGDLEGINPNDVANVTVLKDAAAASIWGVRAGNGVIVVTTRKGKYKQPLSVSLNSNVTMAGKPDVFYNPNYLNSSDFIDIERFLFDNGKYNAALGDKFNYPVISPVVRILERERNGDLPSEEAEKQLDALRDNDIRKEELKYFYRMPVAQQYALSMSGGTKISNHYLSVGYDKMHTNLVHNDNSRLSINSQNTFRPVKNLEVSAGMYYVRSAAAIDSAIRSTSGVSFIPYYEFKDASGKLTVFDRDYDATYKASVADKGFLNWDYVPLNELGRSPLVEKGNDIRLNAGLKYTIKRGLSADIKYQYRRVSSNREQLDDLESYSTRNLVNKFSVLNDGKVTGYNVPLGGVVSIGIARELSYNVRWQLGYQNNWGKHALSAISGYELSEYNTVLNGHQYYGFDPVTKASIPVDSVTTFRLNPSGFGTISTGRGFFGVLDRIRSAFANASYTYNYKYTLSGSARIDGSNYFGVNTNQKNVPLWSVGALWHLDREDFFTFSWFQSLKLRTSYGYNGNLDKRNTGITTFRRNALGSAFTNLPFASIINIGNPELRWERIAIANFGIDFSLKDQILKGSLEYYFKRGSDILGDKAFPANTGIKILRGNFAELAGHGFDVSITSQNMRGKLNWQTNFFFSAVADHVEKYDLVEPVSLFYVGSFNVVPVEDKSISGVYSYKWAGLDPENGDPLGYVNGEISRDYSTILNNTAVADLEYHGSSRPTFFGSINNTFFYNRFTLGVNINFKLGYYFRKPSVNYYDLYNVAVSRSMNSDYGLRWQKPGDEKITSVPSIANNSADNGRDKFYNSSPATVGKGDHIRLQDISLNYDIGDVYLKSLSIKELQLYCYVNNIGLLWKANDFGLDPDFVPGDNNRFMSPLPRSFSFGIKANF